VGVIEGVLPNALFRVRLENGRSITAGVSNALRHQVVRLIVGDRVKLKLTTFDPNRGQVTEKL
jgi:translation initiation factor IF-1